MMANMYKNPYMHPFSKISPQPPSQASSDQIRAFHSSLPSYSPTPLISLPSLAAELGAGCVLLKDESSRLGLPAFKILGASWASARAVAQRCGIPLSDLATTTSLADLSRKVQAAGLVLYAATDGNHGRAVARMAAYLGICARIFVPRFMDAPTRVSITSEGKHVEIVVYQGSYDETVLATRDAAREHDGGRGLLVSDTALDADDDTPRWVVEGYQTLFSEIDEQVAGLTDKSITHVLTPLGVGSLCSATCWHYGRDDTPAVEIVSVESVEAACFQQSLRTGHMVSIETGFTICSGMCCGSVSVAAWPLLKARVTAALTVSDAQVEKALHDLHFWGVKAGPCGAATAAGSRMISDFGPESVVVLLCTEGERPFDMHDSTNKL